MKEVEEGVESELNCQKEGNHNFIFQILLQELIQTKEGEKEEVLKWTSFFLEIFCVMPSTA